MTKSIDIPTKSVTARFNLIPWWKRAIPKPTIKRKAPMTVCIAAICETGTIIGASDRMMTSGDVEFEPDLDSIQKPDLPPQISRTFNANTKIYPITTSIVFMTAGDSGFQSEIIQDVIGVINQQVAHDKTRWISVKEMVDIYLNSYNEAKAKRAQQLVFAPYGLTKKEFLSQSGKISTQIVSEIIKKIEQFDSYFPQSHGIETIIAGIDLSLSPPAEAIASPHIYCVYNGDSVVCCDAVGFAAIGSGSRHAASQFMLAGHSPYSSSSETLLLTYLAKKRSEVAPGVGEGTDTFVLGPNLGTFAMFRNLPDLNMKEIERIYESVDLGQREAFRIGMAAVKKYIATVFEKRTTSQPQSSERAEQLPPENKS